MVVTELIEYSDDITKKLKKEFNANISSFDKPCIMLKVASWGESYYIDLNEYYELSNGHLLEEGTAVEVGMNIISNNFQSNILYINNPLDIILSYYPNS